jgi:hypothetical protein
VAGKMFRNEITKLNLNLNEKYLPIIYPNLLPVAIKISILHNS